MDTMKTNPSSGVAAPSAGSATREDVNEIVRRLEERNHELRNHVATGVLSLEDFGEVVVTMWKAFNGVGKSPNGLINDEPK